jgi:hypothetical protein
VIERLEQDAVERYGIDEVVTNLEVLERIEPSESLLRAVLHTKHLMNPRCWRRAQAGGRGGAAHHGKARDRGAPGLQRQPRPAPPLADEDRAQLRLQADAGRQPAPLRPERRKLYVERPVFISRTSGMPSRGTSFC